MIYFDAAATTLQKPPQVARAVRRAMERLASPGRGGYAAAEEAAECVFSCRALAAEYFEAQPEQVVFTMNATHGLNLAIKSLVGPGQRAVISGFEHNAVRRPLYACGAELAVAGRRLFDAAAVLEEFDRAVTPGTAAVVCTHVSNVFGFVLPVEQIAALCRARGVPFVLDASQSAGCLPVSLRRLGAAFIAMPGHKGLYGPQGTGILLCAQPGRPLLEGGTGSFSIQPGMPEELPERLEAGTQNVCGIAGLRAGLQFLQDMAPGQLLRHEQLLRRQLERRLQPLPEVACHTARDDALQTGVLSLRFAGWDCEDAAAALAGQGIAVRAGLHCAPLAHESAGTLDGGTVRVSFSAFNTAREVEEFARAAGQLAALGRKRG